MYRPLRFHQIIVTVQKYTFVKAKPRVIHYRCYKDFDNISFRNVLRAGLSVSANYNEFDKVYLQVLNNHAPMKSKTVRANHGSYVYGTKKSDYEKILLVRQVLQN